MKNIIITICLTLGFSGIIKAQSDTLPSFDRSGFYIEFQINGLTNHEQGGNQLVDIEELLSGGWGVGLQTSWLSKSGFGLVFKVNNDVISIEDRASGLRQGTPKVIRQSFYQGITYMGWMDGTKQRFFVQPSLSFGYSRLRFPTIRYLDGTEFKYHKVSGFSIMPDFALGYKYGKRSMIKLSCGITYDFMDYTLDSPILRFEDHDDVLNLRVSVGHATRF